MTVLCSPSAAAGSLAIVADVVRSRTAFLEPTSGPAQSASGKSSPVATPTLFHVTPAGTEKPPDPFERMRTMPLAYMIGEAASASGKFRPVARNAPPV